MFFSMGFVFGSGQSTFSEIANEITPHISIGHAFINIFAGVMGFMFFASAFNLWRMHRQNPLGIPLNKVITTVLLALLFLAIPLMNRPSETISVKPIPIVKQKKSSIHSEEKSDRKTHWSTKKSIQINN